MKNYSINDIFETYDLGLAASLITAGLLLDSLDKKIPNKVKFIFLRQPDLDNIIQSYWNRSLQIDALSYFNNVKMLKNRIYSE